MYEAEMILEGVDVFEGTVRERLSYDAKLGFLALNDPPWAKEPGITVAGFYAPPKDEYPPISLPLVTKWDEVPEYCRTIHEVGKGVGRRLYNTPQAAMGLQCRPSMLGMYSFRVVPERILDLRKGSDATFTGKVGRAAQQIGRIVQGRRNGLQEAVEDVHVTYGEAEAVILNQPPQPAVRQWMRGARSPMPSAFLIARRPKERLPLLGRYAA